MSNKLIDLNGLTEYKAKSDLKYQNKLTAGNSITLNNGVISAAPTYGYTLSGSQTVTNNSSKELGSITLAPGIYFLQFTCQFASNANGYRRCTFSTYNQVTPDVSFTDRLGAASGSLTQTAISAIFQVSASDFPNGKTFGFYAFQNSGSSLTAYPRCYYLKF